MGYAKIDHRVLTDPKTEDLKGNPFRMYIRMIVWCSREESDGCVPTTQAMRMGTAKDLRELCERGLTTTREGYVCVANYLKHQTSKAKIAEKRGKERTKKQSQRSVSPGDLSTENRVQRTENRVQSTETKRVTPTSPKGDVRKTKARKWTIVPDDWSPGSAHITKCAEHGLDLETELRDFRNWEFKSPKTDADRAFHRWLDESKKRMGSQSRPGLARTTGRPLGRVNAADFFEQRKAAGVFGDSH